MNVQSPPKGSVGSEAALRYLAGYVRGSPIGNRRLVADDGERVTFTMKDYRNGGERKNITIDGAEFVRRFLLHILPFRFWRVRYRGFLSGRAKKKSLAVIRQQLGVEEVESPGSRDKSQNEAGSEELQIKPPRCPKCGAKEMVWLAELQPQVDWIRRRYSHFARQVRGAGFGPRGFGPLFGSNMPRPP